MPLVLKRVEGPFQRPCGHLLLAPFTLHLLLEHHEEVSKGQPGKVGVAERRERGWKQASER